MNNHNGHLLRRTKIIATLGPATDDPAVMEQLIYEGVNLVRLNFSHSSHEEHQKRIELVRSLSEKRDRVVGILADMQGPKIRVASFQEGRVTLVKGDAFVLDASLDPHSGTHASVGIDYKELPKDVKKDDVLLLDDGPCQPFYWSHQHCNHKTTGSSYLLPMNRPSSPK